MDRVMSEDWRLGSLEEGSAMHPAEVSSEIHRCQKMGEAE